MNPLHLTEDELKRFIETGEVTIIRPMEPQPREVTHDGRWYRMPSGGLSLNCYPEPYGKPGDEFWVQEIWRQGFPETRYSKGLIYLADKERSIGMREYSDAFPVNWQPASSMPQWASRHTAIHQGTEVVRVQDVTEEQILKLGIFKWPLGYGFYTDHEKKKTLSFPRAHLAFASLWESENGHKYQLSTNPWAWIHTFRRKG